MSDYTCGIHAVRALIAADSGRVRRLIVAGGRRRPEVADIVAEARAEGIRVDVAERRALDRLTDGARHQGLVAECHRVLPAGEREFAERFAGFEEPFLLVLDGIEDPRNLGACLRSADAAGVDAVLLPRRGGAPLSGAVARTASGAMEHLFIVEVANVARRLAWLRERGVWVVGGSADGAIDYDAVRYDGAVAIVVGGEGTGLRRLTREHCDHLARIPLGGAVSSLNVSVATGILLFEAARQRRSRSPEGAV